MLGVTLPIGVFCIPPAALKVVPEVIELFTVRAAVVIFPLVLTVVKFAVFGLALPIGVFCNPPSALSTPKLTIEFPVSWSLTDKLVPICAKVLTIKLFETIPKPMFNVLAYNSDAATILLAVMLVLLYRLSTVAALFTLIVEKYALLGPANPIIPLTGPLKLVSAVNTLPENVLPNRAAPRFPINDAFTTVNLPLAEV